MKRVITIAFLAFFVVTTAAFGAVENSTRRFGIFVGANNGGRDRTMLRYAVSDAQSVSKVFGEMGGIQHSDNVLLIEPSIREIDRQIDLVQGKINEAAGAFKRTEVVFYYSGHSDEEGLLLNRQKYSYRELREKINSLSSDMRIVILDSCSSGAFTRVKGGVKTMPFMIDDSISAEGYAFLTSSSATEASQESDAIRGSYFTHSLVSGLRGAADMVGDGRVTLNEVYRFAYTETLAKTETSLHGAQHPSYDMQISGTGDVVLTDIKETTASLVIAADVTGRISIRDSSDYLMAEITKTNNKVMEIGLEPGLYRLVLQKGDAFYRSEVFLSKDQRTPLSMETFSQINATAAVARGNAVQPVNAADDESDSPEPVKTFQFDIIPDKWMGREIDKVTNNFLLGLVAADGYNLRGIGAGFGYVMNYGDVMGVQGALGFTKVSGKLTGVQGSVGFNMAESDVLGVQGTAGLNIVSGNLTGVQGAAGANWASKNVRGIQSAGAFNYTGGDLHGVQAGVINWTRGGLTGVQAGVINGSGEDGAGVQLGVINISRNEKTVPIGVLNFVKGGIFSPSVWVDDMSFMNVGLKTGSKYVYSILSAGVQEIPIGDNHKIALDRDIEDNLMIYRAGLGVELPLGPVFVNLDVMSGSIINLSALRDERYDDCDKVYDKVTSFIAQARLTAGLKFFRHLGIFVGVSYDYIRPLSNLSPVPDSRIGYTFDWSDDRNIHRLGFFGGIQF
ncbi:caspase family protein [Breznakiella homolactica]|uniref:Caspase family protein n=1 Tax=Breznakiella homolactica TaxID=2798577 RepID=A0A7T7XN99_9SPIR|nr:caspase family protein [Breznakiella homolactica]QQO09489.1 caspase family protein [Breznakiella homolactica]